MSFFNLLGHETRQLIWEDQIAKNALHRAINAGISEDAFVLMAYSHEDRIMKEAREIASRSIGKDAIVTADQDMASHCLRLSKSRNITEAERLMESLNLLPDLE